MALEAPPLTVDFAIVDVDNALDHLRYVRQTLMHIKGDEECRKAFAHISNEPLSRA